MRRKAPRAQLRDPRFTAAVKPRSRGSSKRAINNGAAHLVADARGRAFRTAAIRASLRAVKEETVRQKPSRLARYRDAYSPPKAVEQARKLVESDEVLLIFGPLGTPSNTAIQKYMNTKKVPQLFVQSGATRWNDPKEFPW